MKSQEFVQFLTGRYTGCLLVCCPLDNVMVDNWELSWWHADWYNTEGDPDWPTSPPNDVVALMGHWRKSGGFAGLTIGQFLKSLLEEG
jgi:hypothetical protein